jgi:serine phosphatase RsbU (regulator of sigma subunit)
MSDKIMAWFREPSTRWAYFRSVPSRRLVVLMAAVFCLFSVFGPFYDLVNHHGQMAHLAVFAVMIYSGLNAVLWIMMLSRGTRWMMFLLAGVQVFNNNASNAVVNWVISTFHLDMLAPDAGVHFAAEAFLFPVILSYALFISYIRLQGVESFRMANELRLAHGIQKTLVPPVCLRTASFEVYGISFPSEQVGGDLVDVVALPGGDAIAYLADIAGHGLQAGILMGMLKTAARTALLEAGGRPPDRTLPVLLDRLNTVLPEVKEPHMYATFTGLRLGADGSVYYALAASPPLLHWHAGAGTLSNTEEPQFPLGLLPVSSFEGSTLHTLPGDMLVVATDGILEVCDKPGNEYGIDGLKDVIAANARNPLPDLAQKILAGARSFGKQFDDQTILLVRRL